MVQKFVYPPEQQAQFEQLQAEIDELLCNLLALKQQSSLKQEAALKSSALPPETLVLSESY
ncbi:hypothetical protein IFO70_01725 [Phormidium tenue FACHB-886]|nr:hypothetical protein [Phormidium tenue FACHB-886]